MCEVLLKCVRWSNFWIGITRMFLLAYRYHIEQERANADRRYPASSTRQDVENYVKQSPVCATGTPSLLRQPSPLKELWVRSQMAGLGQQSPAISTIPSLSPLKMQLFGILKSLPNKVQLHRRSNIFSNLPYNYFWQNLLGSQLPQSRLPMPKSWLSIATTPVCVFIWSWSWILIHKTSVPTEFSYLLKHSTFDWAARLIMK